jgi:Tol biopolymer transport system component
MTEPIPGDTNPARRNWLIAGVLSIIVVLIGVGIAFAVLALRHPTSGQPTVYTPAPETSAAASSALTSITSAATTSSTTPTSSADSTSATSTPPGQIVRVAKVAYRLNGRLYVSGEDGADAQDVVGSASGAFSLSPDGRTLAFMEGTSTATDHAVLIDTTTRVRTTVSSAAELPTWAPDSSWLAYTSGSGTTSSIRRVNRDGSQDSLVLSKAAEPEISPDGKRIAFTRLPDLDGAPQEIQVYDLAAKTSKFVPGSKGAVSFRFASGGVLYFAKSTAERSLFMVDVGLAQSSAIASLPPGTAQQTPGPLYPSPDGSKVLLGMIGDDGNNSVAIADVSAKSMQIISKPDLRAATPVGWVLDGSAVLYIDGNPTIPSETKSLYRMKPDGTSATLIKSGAGL